MRISWENCVGALLLTVTLSLPAYAGRLFLVPAGTDPSEADATFGTSFPMTAEPGDVVTLVAYLQNQEDLIRAFGIQFRCDAASEFDWPAPARYMPGSVSIDTEREDYIFAEVDSFPAIDVGQCKLDVLCQESSQCSGASHCSDGMCVVLGPRTTGVVFLAPSVAFPDETRYVSEVSYVVPTTAWGTTTIRPICCVDDADCDGVADAGCGESQTHVLGDSGPITISQVDGVEITVTAPLRLTHGDGEPGQTAPFSGYIDPRSELDPDGTRRGVTSTTMRFSQPVFGSETGDPVSTSNFTIASTGGDMPIITDIEVLDAPNTFVRINFDRPIPLQQWTTVTANVFDVTGAAIVSDGNLGESGDESDRVDIAALPGDVDQNGATEPADVFRFRQLVNDVDPPARGPVERLADTDRNGEVTPVDLFRLRQTLFGTTVASQPWANEALLSTRP
jgi:hypothetical protein